MLHRTTMTPALVALLMSCGCGGDGQRPSGMTKDEARSIIEAGTTGGRDLCAENAWYGDGECDGFCLLTDGDCNTACDASPCLLYCENGRRHDARGCELCECADATVSIACGSTALYARTHDGCAPMDAVATSGGGQAHCPCLLGYAWDGSACVALGDCACQGADCDQLTATIEECQAQHAICVTRPVLTCGSTDLHAATHDVCAPMDATEIGEGDAHCNCLLGFAWNGTACVALADCACQGADCGKLTTSQEECLAEHATCGTRLTIGCGSAALFADTHAACAPMDVTAVGDGPAHCPCVLGFAWNGTACEMIGDCECQGADCDKLTETIEECQAQHAGCG